MDDAALERLQNLQAQVMVMARTGRSLDLARVRYCTAGRFSDDEIRHTLVYLARVGLLSEL
jgi:hypothetical protein